MELPKSIVVNRHVCLALLVSVFFAGAAYATACPDQYVEGQAPVIKNPKLGVKTTEVCYEAFSIMHSGVTRTPLWSAEHLVRANIEAAQSMLRQNAFHADAHLPYGERAELGDYARSGYDRGHMSPNGDMPTRSAQYESFTLANMVPQNPDNNRHIWEGIESSVRRLAMSDGDIFVLSGPAFIGDELEQVGHVLVPTHLFKVVYRPRLHQAAAYFLKNEATKEYTVISVAKLEKILGIDLLPGVSRGVKDTVADLPRPTPHSQGDNAGTSATRQHGTRTATADDYKLNQLLLSAVEQLLKIWTRKGSNE